LFSKSTKEEIRMADYTPADEKCLALTYALTALIKALVDSGALDRDRLFSNLAGARESLERVGETGAAVLLASLNESLLGI
jgi:hypothetical protein